MAKRAGMPAALDKAMKYEWKSEQFPVLALHAYRASPFPQPVPYFMYLMRFMTWS